MTHTPRSRYGGWLLPALVIGCADDGKEPSSSSTNDASTTPSHDARAGDHRDAANEDHSGTGQGDASVQAGQDAGQITVTGMSLKPDARAGVSNVGTPDGSLTHHDAGAIDEAQDASDTSEPAVTSGELSTCGAASQVCCEASSCDDGLSCLGAACSCVHDVAHGVIVRNDGRVACHTGSTQTPIVDNETFESLSDVTFASTSNRHGCAVTSDGKVRCWAAYAGANGAEGVLANGTLGTETVGQWLATPVLTATDVPLVMATHISSYAFAEGPRYPAGSCVVSNGGQVWCWGASTLLQGIAYDGFAHSIMRDDLGNPTAGATVISVGASHACYLNDAGEVYCWGANSYGSAGVGSDAAVTYPTRAGALVNVSKVSASDNFTCAVVASGDDQGQVFCWGLNTSGQLGIGAPEANSDCGTYCKQLPTRVRVSDTDYLVDVMDIAVGKRAACALTNDEKVYCWGIVHGHFAVPLTEQQRTAGQEVIPIDGNVAIGPNGALWDFANYSNDSWLRLVLKDGRFIGTRDNASVADVNCGTLD